MKRALAALLSAVLLSGAVAISAIAAHGDDGYVCDQKDMHTMKTVPFEFVWDTQSAAECDFRLLSTEAPLSWTADEYFFGGTFWWLEPEDVEEAGMNPGDVMKYLGQIDEHLFWGDGEHARRAARGAEAAPRAGLPRERREHHAADLPRLPAPGAGPLQVAIRVRRPRALLRRRARRGLHRVGSETGPPPCP